MSKTTIKSFVKQFVAAVKGDDATVVAEKVFRQAQSALNSQISSLQGDTVGLEDAVGDAKEALDKARINYGGVISDRNYYVRTLLDRKNAVTKAEEALETHKEKIDFLKAELDALTKEEEVEAIA